jgi:hypothetical protein
MITYILAWFPMVIIGIANGILRERWYGRSLPELAAHQVSTLVAIVFLGVYIWLVVRLRRPRSFAHGFRIGLYWLCLTVAFEFLFGHYIAHHTWCDLFHDYNIFAGRLWLLVPVWIMIAPCLFFRIRE